MNPGQSSTANQITLAMAVLLGRALIVPWLLNRKAQLSTYVLELTKWADDGGSLDGAARHHDEVLLRWLRWN